VTEEKPRWTPLGDEQLEEIKGLDNTTLEHLKLRARKSLFFMAKGVMGYKDVNARVHGGFCKFFQSEAKNRRMGLMPRGHLKSSIATEADSVRLAVDDPDETRILIANEVLANSVAFLTTIKAQFEKNHFLRALFPELILDRFSGPGIQWSSEGATLPRKTTYKEPTWMPLGTGGAATSKHFSRIKGDDLIGLESKKSPAVMRAAINWNRNIESLAIDSYHTVIDWIGTRWLKNDLYGDIIERYGDNLAVFSKSVVDKEGNLIFPEKYNWEMLRIIMETTPDIWASQYMNEPTSEMGSDFDATGLRYFQFDNDGNVVFKKNNSWQKWDWHTLDRVITVDPNSGSKTATDEAVVTCTGLAPDDNAFVLGEYGGRPSPTELVDKIFAMAMRWRPRLVCIEQAGQQNTLFYFEKKMKEEGMFFMVKPLKHKNVAKEDRIRTALEPILATHRLHILKQHQQLRHQIENFPDIKLDDRIDSLAYAVEEWRKPMAMEQQKKNRDVVKLMLSRRNALTGYGG
jgi:uncharacterized protein (UPF0332 family)